MEPKLRGKNIRVSVSGDAGDEQRSIVCAAIAQDLAHRYPLACVTVEGQRADLLRGMAESQDDNAFGGQLAVVDGAVDGTAVVMRIQRDNPTGRDDDEQYSKPIVLAPTTGKLSPCIAAGVEDLTIRPKQGVSLIVESLTMRPDSTKGMGTGGDAVVAVNEGQHGFNYRLTDLGPGLYSMTQIVEFSIPLAKLYGNEPIDNDERRATFKATINLFLDMNLFVYRLSVDPLDIIDSTGFTAPNLELRSLTVSVE